MWVDKLITHEDPFYIHKFFGLIVLMNFTFQYVYYGLYGTMILNNIILIPHILLHVSSFIFKVLEWLNIKTIIKRSSELKVEGHSTDLIINICKELNSSRYISGLGGKSYLEEDKFLKNQIQLDYFENLKIMEYSQLYPNIGFFNDLSALDILFNCGNKWTEYLN